ncbi:MAG: sigma-70 family RNA polymerase sigma factor [bacterium]
MKSVSVISNKSTSSRDFTDDDEKVKKIIARIKQGDKQAFTELVKCYRNQVASLAYKMVNDYDEAADITQDVFVKMSKNIWRYDEKKKFYTWLYRITVNAAIDYIRKHNRHRHEPLEEAFNFQDEDQPGPEDHYHRWQIDEYIKKATDLLNDKQRSAFMLRDVEGCKIGDVANIMNMPEATVRWYLHRARNKIRQELTRKCPHLLMLFGFF